MKKIELLAPAGNILKMKTAFAYDADAVYLGIPDFSMRVRINQFNMAEVKKATEYAHERKKKVYVTINIVAHNKHFKKLPDHVKKLKEIGVDALIVSDPGVMQAIRKVWPKAEIHLSTQANCTNAETAKFWYEQGVKRVVLGREVTLDEIKEIHKAVPKLELEYFIHGAMCMAYSGRCFLSKQILDRSGNLGDCAQPCRWGYYMKTINHDDEFELVEEEHGSYILNSKDLCLVKYLKELISAGVISLKIEGRAKSVYYQAVVCSVYRKAMNLISDKKLSKKELDIELDALFKELKTKLVHRGYTTGFLLKDKAEQNITNAHTKSDWEFCGQVLKVKGNMLHFKVHNTIKVGDQVEIIKQNYDIMKIRLKEMWNAKTRDKMDEAHGGGGGQIAMIDLGDNHGVDELAVLRRKMIK